MILFLFKLFHMFCYCCCCMSLLQVYHPNKIKLLSSWIIRINLEVASYKAMLQSIHSGMQPTATVIINVWVAELAFKNAQTFLFVRKSCNVKINTITVIFCNINKEKGTSIHSNIQNLHIVHTYFLFPKLISCLNWV